MKRDQWTALRKALKEMGLDKAAINKAVKGARRELRGGNGWASLEDARAALGVAGASMEQRISSGEYETRDANSVGYIAVAYAGLEKAIRNRDAESAPEDEGKRRMDARTASDEELLRKTLDW
jgi:hypothetical protein